MFLPAGSQDEIGSKVNNRSRVYEIFRNVTSRRNYKQIATPAVEYAPTFTNRHAGMELSSMLKWFNRDGEIEVLRPDWTTAIARTLVKQNSSQDKWSYQGSVFRNDKDGTESRQAGIEIIHSPEFLGESECLLTALSFLKKLEIDDYVIELGHTEIFTEITKPLRLSKNEFEQLRQAMHDKRKDEVFQLAARNGDEETAAELTALVDAFGSLAMIEHFEERWSENPRLLPIIQHVKRLAKLLKDSGINEILVDLGRVKHLPYYCGIMFRGYLKTNGATCFSGGRYDKLYEQFGEGISAVGLAFDVDKVADQMEDETFDGKICILANDDTLIHAEKIRNDFEGSIVDIQYELPVKNTYDRILEVVKGEKGYEVIEK